MSVANNWESELPAELRSDNYDYPKSLFDDWKDKFIRYEGGDDIPAPVTYGERPLLMARYAVAAAVEPTWAESTHVKIARGDKGVDLITAIRKAWDSRYRSYDGLEPADIELAADELGVYEMIWPFDPVKMEAAEEAERELALSQAA